MKIRRLRISAVLLTLLFIIGIVFTIILIINGVDPFSKADPTLTPQNIIIGNQWNGRFSIAFETPGTGTSATLLIGKDQTNLVTTINDAQGSNYNGTMHLFNATGLEPDQTYYYKFLVNGGFFDDGGKPYSIKILKLSITPFEKLPLSGKLLPAGKTCIIYSHYFNDNGTSLTTMDYAATNGTYTLNMDYLLQKDTYTAFPTEGAKVFTYVKCVDGTRGDTITDIGSNPADINLSLSFSPEFYDNSLKTFGLQPSGSATPIPTGTSIATITPTPFPTSTKIPVTTIKATTFPTVTPSKLPPTGLVDDNMPIIMGLIFITVGIFLRRSIQVHKGVD